MRRNGKLGMKAASNKKTFRNPNARTPIQIEHDDAIIAQEYLKGTTLYKIGKALGIGTTAVQRALNRIRAMWQAKMMRAITEHKAEQLEKLDLLEHEAHLAWKRSQEDAMEIQTTDRVVNALKGKNPLKGPPSNQKQSANQPSGTKAKQIDKTVKVHGQYGDPRFLSIIKDCVAQRCQILGLNTPIAEDPKDAFATQDDVRNQILDRFAKLGQPAPDPNAPKVTIQ